MVDIYGKFMDWAKNLGRPFYPFGYDWRRSNHESVMKFQELIRNVSQKHESKVQIVAHSMVSMTRHDRPTVTLKCLA